jgi:glycine/D-amino acid oxidase-like deaminating enzyme
MRLEEGEIRMDPAQYKTAAGKMPPVFHFDSREPLVSEKTGEVLSQDELWGVYWKHDRRGVQGGAEPVDLGGETTLDPYGPDNPEHALREGFVDFWTSGLAHALGRFEGCHQHFERAPTGGVGCFTFDCFPIFDFAPGVPNAYVIADSNHGFKMIGVGKEVARVLSGQKSDILEPFRFARFAEGDLHPVSASPWPWG